MNNQEYKSKDLAKSAALITSGQQLIRIEREDRVCFFVFNNENVCREVSSKYFFGELLINARDFYEALTRLKNRIFQ